MRRPLLGSEVQRTSGAQPCANGLEQLGTLCAQVALRDLASSEHLQLFSDPIREQGVGSLVEDLDET